MLRHAWDRRYQAKVLFLAILLFVALGLVGTAEAQDLLSQGSRSHASPFQGPTANGRPAIMLAQSDSDGESDAGDSEDSVILEHVDEAWTGGLDGIVERGFVRLLTVYNPLYFAYDGEKQRGLAIDIANELEKHLRKTLGKKAHNLHVVLKPVARDQLLPGLVSGRGDVAAANLTITPGRQELVAFSDPTYPGVRELIVTGPDTPEINSIDDLAEVDIHVRESSSYFQHLTALNAARKEAGKKEIPWVAADERLEDYDLLELLNTGIIPALIVDSHKIAFWSQVFNKVKVHDQLAVNEGGQIAWALRKENPKLREVINGFVKKIRKGSLLGNILIKRYIGDPKWIEDIRDTDAQRRFRETVDFIQRHSGSYEFDWLMITAQGYQESRLDQSVTSKAGAVGVMQVLPTTAADPNVGIPDIDNADSNIHAGVKYLRFLHQRYFNDPEISDLDQVLLSFAAYNAGPRNIAKARGRAKKMELDPNQWFGNVEVAAAKTISREPVTYVRNIYKYYVAFKLLHERRQDRETAREALE